jgi:hypothetical protein
MWVKRWRCWHGDRRGLGYTRRRCGWRCWDGFSWSAHNAMDLIGSILSYAILVVLIWIYFNCVVLDKKKCQCMIWRDNLDLQLPRFLFCDLTRFVMEASGTVMDYGNEWRWLYDRHRFLGIHDDRCKTSCITIFCDDTNHRYDDFRHSISVLL